MAQQPPTSVIAYPASRAVEQVDEYHSQKVSDPFRWLEDVDSDETKEWVKNQNEVTFRYLHNIPERAPIAKRLSELWNYERYGFPKRAGDGWIYTHNNGLQNQNVLYKSKSLDGERELLLDPNLLSKDGTVALSEFEVSPNGKFLAYGISKSGSDWNTWRVRDIASTRDLDDTIEWVKFSQVAWTKDNAGFFYSRYDQPKTESEFTGTNYNQKLYYHKLGTPQESDQLVYERPDEKEWGFRAKVTDDGDYLVISVWRGTEHKNLVFYASITDQSIPKFQDVQELLSEFEAEFEFLGNEGSRFYFETDFEAPNRQVIVIDLEQPARINWRTVVSEKKESIESSSMFRGQIVVHYLRDATSLVRRFDTKGMELGDLETPSLGTVAGLEGKQDAQETFYSFTNYVTPPAVFRLDLATGKSTLWKEPKVDFDRGNFVTERIFYKSKDGTRIPMILSYKKGMEKNGKSRAFLYAYGGFNISITPNFTPSALAWMEQGGIYVVANIRGGGEYGRAWHESAMMEKKQNCFDDFIAAGEFLIQNNYTNSQRLAIHGRSNGGLLIGAAMTQRPDLFAVALPAVGVMDMLRYQKFTIGWAWTSEFGSSDDAKQFENILRYSPLHNLKPGTRYPATMVTTGDHDDRVVPGHSFKFAARLQACQSATKPALIRIETSAGHGAGTPIHKLVEAAADMWAFVIDNTREPISL